MGKDKPVLNFVGQRSFKMLTYISKARGMREFALRLAVLMGCERLRAGMDEWVNSERLRLRLN